MKKIFVNSGDPAIHECYVEERGQWRVFKCKQCPDFEQAINVTTRKMVTKGYDPNIRHKGESVDFVNSNGTNQN